jgi:glutamine amidotransferase-like uncharacterized protein
MSNLDEHRKYIHDLANNFSILDASVSRALTLLTRGHPELNDEIMRLRKADEYIKKSIHTLKAFREHIHNQISQEKEASGKE